MARQSITIQLDDETIGLLAKRGEPIEVLAQLAYSAADGVRRPGRVRREQTDESLRKERGKTDIAIAKERETVEDKADDVVRIARHRADELMQTARDSADDDRSSRSAANEAGAESARTRADSVLSAERSSADERLSAERKERKRTPDAFLAVERQATDQDLSGERAHIDTLIIDQREANERMVSATIRAQELLEEADAAKARAEASAAELSAVAEFRERFIGILGHDLRNPLNSIVMSAALMLRRGHLNGQDAETVARIIRGSQRMTRMITQLLDLTRARLGGGMPIAPEPTDLSEVCRNVVEEFDAPIRLEVEGDVTGTWDPDRLAEVLSNLAGNAIDYATPGSAVIVKAQDHLTEVVVTITNQGPPIPEDVLPFIFEPFRRARQPGTAATGNLGLGLFIAHQIVLSHGGTLEVQSTGGTTTFLMRLPRLAPLHGEAK